MAAPAAPNRLHQFPNFSRSFIGTSPRVTALVGAAGCPGQCRRRRRLAQALVGTGGGGCGRWWARARNQIERNPLRWRGGPDAARSRYACAQWLERPCGLDPDVRA
jgi:hypothetical protein